MTANWVVYQAVVENDSLEIGQILEIESEPTVVYSLQVIDGLVWAYFVKLELIKEVLKVALSTKPWCGFSFPYVYYSDNSTVIIHSDCRNILPLMPEESVDIVVTDPPYGAKYSWCWEFLAREAVRVLKEGGSLFTLAGQWNLPDVLGALTKHLTWVWCLCLPLRKYPAQHGWRLRVTWRPCLWLAKGKPRLLSETYVADNLFVNGSREGLWHGQHLHKWGQSEEMAIWPILNFTKPGDLVLDPFLGSGTTAYVAKKLNRRCIGIEINEEFCKQAALRCSQQVFVTEDS